MSEIIYVDRQCLCGRDITRGGTHFCTLLNNTIDMGEPEIDYEAMAEEHLKQVTRAAARDADMAESTRQRKYAMSYSMASLTGNALMGMDFGGDAMGAAAGAAEKRGETLEKYIQENHGDIRNQLAANGMSDAEVSKLLDAYTRKKDSWF